MADKDFSVSNIPFVSTHYGRNQNGQYGPFEENTPHQYRIITQDYVERQDTARAFGEWASAIAVSMGDPTQGIDPGAFGSGTPPFDNPWRFNSLPFQPISAIGSSVAAPATFDLRIWQYTEGIIPNPMSPSSTVDGYWGGSFGGFFTPLDPDVVHTVGGIGANAMYHEANMLDIPQWNAKPGNLISHWFTGIPTPFVNGQIVTDLFMAITACRVPTASEQNPKLGLYQYTSEKVVPGLKMRPESVTVDPVSGDIEFVLGGHKLFSEGLDPNVDPQLNHSGREVLIYIEGTPLAATGTAIQTGTINNAGGPNRVTIAGGFGGGTLASTNPSDYVVVLLGPVVTDWNFIDDFANDHPGGLVSIGHFTNATDSSQAFVREEGFVPVGTESYRRTLTIPSIMKLGSSGRGIYQTRRIAGIPTWAPGLVPTQPVIDYVARIDSRQHPLESDTETAIQLESSIGGQFFKISWDGQLEHEGTARFIGDVQINPGNLFVDGGVGEGFVTATGGFNNAADPTAINEVDGVWAFGQAGGSVSFAAGLSSLQSLVDFNMNSLKIEWAGGGLTPDYINMQGVRNIKTEILFGSNESELLIQPTNTQFPFEQVHNVRVKGIAAESTSSRVYAGRFVAADTLEYRGTTPYGYFEAQGSQGYFGYGGVNQKRTQQIWGATSLVEELVGGDNGFGGLWKRSQFILGSGLSPAVVASDHYKEAQPFGGVDYPACLKVAPNPGGDNIGFPVKLRLMDTVDWDEVTCWFTYRFNGPLAGTDGQILFEIFSEKWNAPSGGAGVFIPPMPQQCQSIAFMNVPLFMYPPNFPSNHTFDLTAWGSPFQTPGNASDEATYWLYVFLQDQSAQGETTLLHNVTLLGKMQQTPTQISV